MEGICEICVVFAVSTMGSLCDCISKEVCRVSASSSFVCAVETKEVYDEIDSYMEALCIVWTSRWYVFSTSASTVTTRTEDAIC
jgi:hypothetical protein